MALTALVTGASSGIGEAFAGQLAERGYDLVLVARRESRLAELRDRLEAASGITAHVLSADLSEPDAGARLAERVRELGLDVELLVNNAGFGTYGPLVSEDPQRISEEVRVNVSAVMDLTRQFLPGMVERGHGGIINVASMAAFQAIPQMAVYAATKAFVLSFSEAVAHEVGGKGVTVFALCPGATETEFFDVAGAEPTMGSAQTPEQVAAIALESLGAKKRSGHVVSGRMNRAVTRSVRLLPRRLVANAAARAMRRR